MKDEHLARGINVEVRKGCEAGGRAESYDSTAANHIRNGHMSD